jgi:DNA-binding GntR family transcriptional regulator
MIREYSKKKKDAPMKKLKNSNAWMKVYEHLRGGIIKGTYSPGERINEREIAGLVGVSRTPTREALKVLEYEGFVNNITQKGAVVKKYSLGELDVIHRMLARLESLAVEMAAPRLTGKDLADLQKMTNRLKSLAHKGNYSDYLTLNIEFHLFFARMSGSEELLEAISQLRKRIFRFAYSQVIADHETKDYLGDHQEMIDALMDKTREKPEKIMKRHVDRSRKSFLGFYKKIGLLAT